MEVFVWIYWDHNGHLHLQYQKYYCLSALFFVIQTRMTHWYQRLPIHTRLTGKNTTNQQENGHRSMQCENAREIKIQMRTKETRLICNLRQMSNRGEKKLGNSPSFGAGSDTMRYSATWLSMCWAATMCCPSWLVWICWAGPDGLLKALPYGIPETLHSPYHHTQTLNCYSCYRDYHYHYCYSYASFSPSMTHIVVLLRSKMFDLFRRSALPSFQRYCLCPTGCLVITVFPCI